MEKNLAYYKKGKELFEDGVPVYINKILEQKKAHLHAHDFFEIAYAASGAGIHIIGENEYSISKGDLFIIDSDTPHEFRTVSTDISSGLVIYNCIFKPGFIDASLFDCRDFSEITYHFMFRSLFSEDTRERADIKLLGKDTHEVGELYEKMYREYKTREKGYIEILRAYVIELLIMIFRLYGKKDDSASNPYPSRRKIVEKVIDYMKDNYSKSLTLDDLSVLVFLNKNSLCRTFRECTGMTVTEYAQRIRVEEACRLLKETDRKTADIAMEVGYRDVKYFNTVFRRITGKTPGRYRK